MLAVFERPATTPLALGVALVVAGWIAYQFVEQITRPASPDLDLAEATGDAPRPGALADGSTETPALVALLTNGFRLPSSSITATLLDLAARGWVRIAAVDGEPVVVTRGAGEHGDALLPYEQQVLAHVSSRAYNDVASASALELAQPQLDRRWMRRFGRGVAADATARGLATKRFSPVQLLAPFAIAVVAFACTMVAIFTGGGASLEDSWRSRALALATALAAAALTWRGWQRVIGVDQRPTELGDQRRSDWLAYRKRLRQRIPGTASVVAGAPQQRALATACVMGVAEQVHRELPITPEDARRAWSDAGGRARIVRVRYPVRPGYGQHPVRVAAVGLVVGAIAVVARRELGEIADGTSLQSTLERIPGQVDLVRTIADVLAVLCWIPILWAGWSVIAGCVDAVIVRERIGLVVRTRRPNEVADLARFIHPTLERDRFAVYLAVDDGQRSGVAAWLANDRTAAPQGAQARVRVTPLLGYVRSSEPVGTAARAPATTA